jgi:hypothetical protein
MEFFDGKHHSEVGHRHIVLVDVVAVLLRLKSITNEAYSQQMVVKVVSDGSIGSTNLGGLDDFLVELMGNFQRVRWYGDLKSTNAHWIGFLIIDSKGCCLIEEYKHH